MGILNVTPDSLWGGAGAIDPEAARGAPGADGRRRRRDLRRGRREHAPGRRPGGRRRAARAPRRASCGALREAPPPLALSIDTSLAPVAGRRPRRRRRCWSTTSPPAAATRPCCRWWPSAARRSAWCTCAATPARCRATRATATWWARCATTWRRGSAAAVDAGVPEERVLLDPGIGFGKTLEHNLALLAGAPGPGGPGAPAAGRGLAQEHVRHAPRAARWASGCRPRSPRAWRRWRGARPCCACTTCAIRSTPLARVDGGGAAEGDERRAPHVSIHGLEAFGRHGVHDAERELGQRFVVDLELELLAPRGRAQRRPRPTRSTTPRWPHAVGGDRRPGRRCALLERLAGADRRPRARGAGRPRASR